MIIVQWVVDGRKYKGSTAAAVVEAMRTDPANHGGEQDNEQYRLNVARRAPGPVDTEGDLAFLVSLVDAGYLRWLDG